MKSEHPHPLVKVHTFNGYRVVPDGPLPDGRDVGPQGQPGWAQDWSVEADLREGGSVQRFSASLACASQMGTFSHPWERPIPESILRRIERLEEQLVDAGLY
jgi:hypothetical protein